MNVKWNERIQHFIVGKFQVAFLSDHENTIKLVCI